MIAYVDGLIRQVYTIGERIWTWCAVCMDREWHVWDGEKLNCTGKYHKEPANDAVLHRP